MWSSSKKWLLKETSSLLGFMPNAAGTVSLLKELEMEGLVQQLENCPVWGITDKGKIVLSKLKLKCPQ